MGTSICPPRAAVTKSIGTSLRRSASLLLKNSLSLIDIKTYRSPEGPPFSPASPSPPSLILVPSSTPLGIFTDNFLFFLTHPLPEQLPQGFSIMYPLPLQTLQVLSTVKNP